MLRANPHRPRPWPPTSGTIASSGDEEASLSKLRPVADERSAASPLVRKGSAFPFREATYPGILTKFWKGGAPQAADKGPRAVILSSREG
jgi:hypothetical protein